MSTIQAKIIDRVITFTERPLLYSHAKNVDYIHVTFDDEWTGYTKTAVFYRDINKPYAVLMDDDTATIPPEVMETDGKIYMGVFGVKDDEVLNSEVVFYPVGVGALTEGAMPEVTPDLWQDIISRIEEIKETGANIGQYVETATEAAQTATTKAQEAQISASTASTAATNATKAQTAAETAQGKAETAQSKAETAQSGAESAKADAVQAKTDAETAKTQAETAKTDAVSARDSAQGYANSAESAKTQAETAKTQAVNAKNEAVEAANNAAADVEDNVSILETVTGETVTVNDSAEDVIYGLKLYGKSVQQTEPGKNLCSKSEYFVQGDNTNRKLQIEEIPAGTYTISMNCPAHETITETDIMIEKDNTSLTEWLQLTTGQRSSVTFTISQSANAVLFSGAGGTYTEIQIEVGETATPYEPYKAWSTPSPENPVPIESVVNPTVSVYGENLVNVGEYTYENRGVTFTAKDGAVQVSGTATSESAYGIKIPFLPKGTYFVNGGKGNILVRLAYCKTGESYKYAMSGTSVTIDDEDTFLFQVYVKGGKTVNDTVYPMLIRGKSALPFVQYTEQTLATQLNLYAVPVESGGNYTDEDGQQWIADVADFETGKITRNVIAKTFNGTESLYINSNDTLTIRDYDFMRITVQNQNTLIGIISNMFVANTWVKVDQNNDPQIALAWGSGIGVKMPGIDTTQDFKTFLSTNNLHVVGLRNTPTTEDIPANIMQAYKNLHTNEGTTNVFADSDPQAGIELSYRNNRQLADNVVEVVSKKASSAPVTSVNGKTGDVVLTIDDLNIEDVTEPLYEDISSLENGYANSVLSAREISTWTSLDSWLGDGMEDAKKMRGVWRFGATGSLSGLPTQIDNGSMLHMYITGTNTLVLYFYAKDGIYRRNVSWMGSVWDTSTSEWVQIANNDGEIVDEHTTQISEIETELNTVWARQVLYGEISPKTFTAAGVSLWDIPIADAYHGKSALVELVGMMIDTDGSASVEICQYAGATEKQPFSTRDFSAGAGIGYSTIKSIKIDDDTTGIRIKGIVGSTSQMGKIRSGSYCYVKITILNS